MRVMAEVDVDIAGAESVTPEALPRAGRALRAGGGGVRARGIDLPGLHRRPWGRVRCGWCARPFDDPPKLASGLEGEAALAPYRRVRNEIRAFVEGELPALLDEVGAG